MKVETRVFKEAGHVLLICDAEHEAALLDFAGKPGDTVAGTLQEADDGLGEFYLRLPMGPHVHVHDGEAAMRVGKPGTKKSTKGTMKP